MTEDPFANKINLGPHHPESRSEAKTESNALLKALEDRLLGNQLNDVNGLLSDVTPPEAVSAIDAAFVTALENYATAAEDMSIKDSGERSREFMARRQSLKKMVVNDMQRIVDLYFDENP